MDPNRPKARELALAHLARGTFFNWFEDLYSMSGGRPEAIPWADMAPNPNFVDWLERAGVRGQGGKALVVGCGLGDDAHELARRGFEVTAFDLAASAIDWCRRRFGESRVEFLVADLLDPPDAWRGSFEFILESYTLQSLPPDLRASAMRTIAGWLAPGGTLLVITRACDPAEDVAGPPWPLTKSALDAFRAAGLEEVSFEDYVEQEDPPVRRFRAAYHAGAG